MAQSGYTPILIYASGTASNVPLAANMTSSASGAELALNYADGKLYYKNSAGTVTLLASTAGASGDVVGPSSATDNALARFDTTTGKLIQNSVGILSDAGVLTGLTGLTSSGNVTLSSLTSGRVPYASTGGLLVDSANLLYSGTDLTVYGITVGRGAGAVSTNTAVGNTALAVNTTGSRNTAIGYFAALYTTGSSNTAVGISALSGASGTATGSTNTAIGDGTLTSNTSGSYNTAVGASALASNTSGTYSVAVGYNALNASTASGNVGVGPFAGFSTVGNGAQTFVGYVSGRYMTGGSNTAVGSEAMVGISGSATGANNTAVGNVAMTVLTSGTGNVAVGDVSSRFLSSGSYNVAIGQSAMYLNQTSNGNIAIGYQAGYTQTTGAENVYMGYLAGQAYNGSYSTIIGFNAGRYATSATSVVYLGNSAGSRATAGSYSIYIGESAGFGATSATNNTGAYNVSVGGVSMYLNTTGTRNAAVGHEALRYNSTGSNNTAVGFNALYNNTGASNSVAIGYNALFSSSTGSSCVAVGGSALYSSTVSNFNVAIGTSAMYNWNNTGSDGSAVAVGYQALVNSTTGLRNTAIGYQSGLNISGGSSFNTAIGSGSMVGLSGTISGTDNIAIGSWHDGVIEGPMAYLSSGSENVAVGQASMKGGGVNSLTGSYNAALGNRTLGSITSGINNVAVGYNAGYNMASGHENVFVGRNAGFTNAGNANTFVGAYAGNVSTGSSNTFIGSGLAGSIYASGERMTTGNKNVILGNFSGINTGLNIATSNGYVVLSDGDGNVATAYSQVGSGNQNIELKGNFASSYNVPTVVAGTGVVVDCVEAVNSSASSSTYGWMMKIYFSLYQATGSSKSLRLTFSRANPQALVGFRMLINGEYPSDSITQYIARIATAGGSGGTYSSSNYATGDLGAGSWTNPLGTATSDFYWQSAGAFIANSGGIQGVIEIVAPLENAQAFSSITIGYV